MVEATRVKSFFYRFDATFFPWTGRYTKLGKNAAISSRFVMVPRLFAPTRTMRSRSYADVFQPCRYIYLKILYIEAASYGHSEIVRDLRKRDSVFLNECKEEARLETLRRLKVQNHRNTDCRLIKRQASLKLCAIHIVTLTINCRF